LSNNYYAFGLQTKDSWTRMATQPNQYLYNAGSELNEATSNYEMMYRSYDPAIGRMSGVDPMVNSFASLTPYNYSFNDPVYWNDPSGAVPEKVSENGGNYEDCSCGMYGDNWNLATYGGSFGMYGVKTGWSDGVTNAIIQNVQAAKNGNVSALQSYAARNGISYGGGLQGLTSAMVALNAVQNGTYGANTFSYSVGNKTYGGTYHTTGGTVTSAAVSQVMASSNGGLVSMGDLDIFEFDGQQSNDGGLNWAAGGRAFVRTFLPFGNDIYPESEEPGYDPNRRVISATLPDLPIGPGSLGMAKRIVSAKKLVTPQTLRAAKAYYRQTLEHIKKLRLYVNNPQAYDNLGHLAKNASNPQIQQQIIAGRINHLTKEIKAFNDSFWRLFQ